MREPVEVVAIRRGWLLELRLVFDVIGPQLVHQPLPARRRLEPGPASIADGEIGTPLRSSMPTS